jgi:hypothetical protein
MTPRKQRTPPKQLICPIDGRRFTSWRGKKYCSERCRKNAENARLGYVRGDEASLVADALKNQNKTKQYPPLARLGRGEETLVWIACNAVTSKLIRPGSDSALGWALKDGQGWFGKIGGGFSFGPSTRRRAQKAVLARLEGQPLPEL